MLTSWVIILHQESNALLELVGTMSVSLFFSLRGGEETQRAMNALYSVVQRRGNTGAIVGDDKPMSAGDLEYFQRWIERQRVVP